MGHRLMSGFNQGKNRFFPHVIAPPPEPQIMEPQPQQPQPQQPQPQQPPPLPDYPPPPIPQRSTTELISESNVIDPVPAAALEEMKQRLEESERAREQALIESSETNDLAIESQEVIGTLMEELRERNRSISDLEAKRLAAIAATEALTTRLNELEKKAAQSVKTTDKPPKIWEKSTKSQPAAVDAQKKLNRPRTGVK